MDHYSFDFYMSIAFLLFVAWFVAKDSRMQEDRRDRREREYRDHDLREKREFGYETVEHANNVRPLKRHLFAKRFK